MLKVLKYSIYDLMRSKWAIAYFAFYLIMTVGLLLLTNDHAQALISLLNIVIVLSPLLSIIFGVIYFYNSREFTNLLLAQPLTRREIFLGQFLGVVGVQSTCLLLGLGIPFLVFGILASGILLSFVSLLVAALFLTIIFTAIAFLIGLRFENRIKGFGLAVFIWLFLAVIYDGLFLVLLSVFRDYPLENFALIGILLNPIDLSRVLVMINLDIAALMGFTGAVFKNLLGNYLGLLVALMVLTCWALLPIISLIRDSMRKDF